MNDLRRISNLRIVYAVFDLTPALSEGEGALMSTLSRGC